MRTVAVVGKNFGDEGKGLVTASLCSLSGRSLVVRHNGGAQSGHTVENTDNGTRFVHHQIGSGAEYGAQTLLAESFHPDLFQLGKEIGEFREVFGFTPVMFAEPDAPITTIDDVLLNMAIETQRGDSRHGSCGMGINECIERIHAGYRITVGDVAGNTEEHIRNMLRSFRTEYTVKRAEELCISPDNPYSEMLLNSDVTENFAETVCKNVHLLRLTGADQKFLTSYDQVIFESGQGLLLDSEYEMFAPHLTSSRTGVFEPVRFLEKRGFRLDEAIYVTRPYVTRHGAGPLPSECEREELPGVGIDETNIKNDWQGQIRYARHGDAVSFFDPAENDAEIAGLVPSLAITHLDETDGFMYFSEGNIPVRGFLEQTSGRFSNIYVSQDRQHLTDLLSANSE